MGRRPVPRTSFNSDIVYLYRLINSVEIDDKLPQDYREELLGSIRGLILCMQRRPEAVQ